MAGPEGANMNATPVTVSGEGKTCSENRADLRTARLKCGSVRWIAPDPWAAETLLESRLCRGFSRSHLHTVYNIQRCGTPHRGYDEDYRYQNIFHPRSISFYITLPQLTI